MKPKESSVSPAVSPVDSFAMGIQDLAQEFSLIQKKKLKGIIIDEVFSRFSFFQKFIFKKYSFHLNKTNLVERTCTVSVVEKPVRMKISFPIQYPSTSPIFQFMNGTNLPQQIQNSIIEILNEKARSYVDSKRPCLSQCLNKLVSSVRGKKKKNTKKNNTKNSFLFLKQKLDFSEEDDFVSQLDVSNTIVSSPDDKIPCPRTSRAVFGGTGIFVSFFLEFFFQ